MGQILRMYGAEHKLYGYRLVNTRTLGLAGEMEIDKNTAYKLIDRVDAIHLVGGWAYIDIDKKEMLGKILDGKVDIYVDSYNDDTVVSIVDEGEDICIQTEKCGEGMNNKWDSTARYIKIAVMDFIYNKRHKQEYYLIGSTGAQHIGNTYFRTFT